MSDPVLTNPGVSNPLGNDSVTSSEQIAADATAVTAGGSAPKAKPALKDRIADLQLSQRASAVGVRLADRMKAVQAAAPAAAELAGKVKSAAGAVRLDKLNRDSLKAGLTAKVESLLKPRAVDDPSPPMLKPTAEARERTAERAAPEEPKTRGREDIEALKARVDDALRVKQEKHVQGPTPVVAAGTDVFAYSTPTPEAPTPDVSAPAAGITSRLKTGVSRLVSRRPAGPTTSDTSLPQTTELSLPEAAGADTPVTAPDVVTQRTLTQRGMTQRTSRTAYAKAEARRPIFSLGLIATALTAGGVLHILTTFAIPAINTGSAFERLRWQLEPNVMRVMPVDANGQTALPFLTADMRYAMCRYDITNSSVQVAATLPDIGWSLALYSPQGDNFYAVPGQDGRTVTAAFTINAAGDRLLLPVPGVRRTDTDAAQVTSPQREGLVVIRAPNRGPAYLPAVEVALKGASCRVLPRR